MLTTMECWALLSSATRSRWTSSRGEKNVRWSSGYPSRNRPSDLYLARSPHANGASAIAFPSRPPPVWLAASIMSTPMSPRGQHGRPADRGASGERRTLTTRLLLQPPRTTGDADERVLVIVG